MSECLFPTRWANDNPPSLEKFTSDFPDDYACADYLAEERWQSGIKCLKCGGNRAWRLESRPLGLGMPRRPRQ
ncbi:transposase [Rhizobium leguminosarum]|uniref:transposase n=1 Tax=Rhizobium leguminosarum TaxID=384 RepID=UPI001C98B209|nr:transposase [Rhizobium leguminosarum]